MTVRACFRSGRRGLATLVAMLPLLSSGMIASDTRAASLVGVVPVGTTLSGRVDPALSADGSTVTGQLYSTAGGTGSFEAFLWTRHDGFRTFSELGPDAPDEALFEPRALSSDAGRIVGSLDGAPAVWEQGVGTSLLPGLPAGTEGARAYGISDDGRYVVGSAHDGGSWTSVSQGLNGEISVVEVPRFVPVSWDLEQGTLQALSNERGIALDVSDDRVVVGQLAPEIPGLTGLVAGFRWDDVHGSQYVPSASSTFAFGWALDAAAISADGTTIVGSTPADLLGPFARHAYAWSGSPGSEEILSSEGLRVIDAPAGAPSTLQMLATGVSTYGRTIVGQYRVNARPVYTPFIWTEARGLEDLEVLLRSLGVSMDEWSLSEVLDVSADGRTILGTGRGPGSALTQIWVAVIPEPSTALLLGAGLACLATRRTRRC
ncbi:MAG: PEP-CTERM sorting domain-containing protein [Myxococcales bacterium]|nr:PEP-CTERM sorting domain-containing protein [Myxococcales bacterium]